MGFVCLFFSDSPELLLLELTTQFLRPKALEGKKTEITRRKRRHNNLDNFFRVFFAWLREIYPLI